MWAATSCAPRRSSRRQARGDADDGHDTVDAERADREGEQEAGVDATREGDAETAGSDGIPRRMWSVTRSAWCRRCGGRPSLPSACACPRDPASSARSRRSASMVGHGAATSLRSPDHSVWKAPARSVRP